MTQFLRTDNTKKRIVRVEFLRGTEEDPDLSYLGRYSHTPSPGCIDRGWNGTNNLKRYFVPAMTAEQTGNPDSTEQDYQRMEAYNDGKWEMIFLQALATISVGGVMQTICSGGLGGVESDSEKDYFSEIRTEQMGELRDILTNLGFSEEEITAAFASAEDA